MQKRIGLILLFVCIAVVMAAGCASQAAPPATVTTPTTMVATPTPTLVTPVQTAPPITIVTTSAPVTTVATAVATTDPILHRWVRELYVPIKGEKYGYEFKFYPGGTINYRYGKTEQISSNLRIATPVIEASGTWQNLGDNKYLVKFLPTAETGAQLIREYTLVPAHEEKGYPGVIIPTHIESSYETDAINKAHVKPPEEMYYPEQAKID